MVVLNCDQDDSELPEILTNITVRNPITHYSCGNGRYTTYEIILETNDFCFSLPKSTIRRRFSEFVYLRRLLKSLNPTIQPPALSSKNLFRDRFSIEFIEQRQKQLEKFMQQILDEPLYLSNKALHLFLQSKLPMREIEAQVSGELPKLPLEKDGCQAIYTDSSCSDISSVESECHNCDSIDNSINCSSSSMCPNLLSTNHEAFVTSLPFFSCSIDIKSKKPQSSMTTSVLTISSDFHNSVDCNHSSHSSTKKKVSFFDTVSV